MLTTQLHPIPKSNQVIEDDSPWLSYTLDMKSRTDYIPRDWVRQVRAQVGNYKRFKSLSAEWVALSIERCRLTMKLTRRP